MRRRCRSRERVRESMKCPFWSVRALPKRAGMLAELFFGNGHNGAVG